VTLPINFRELVDDGSGGSIKPGLKRRIARLRESDPAGGAVS